MNMTLLVREYNNLPIYECLLYTSLTRQPKYTHNEHKFIKSDISINH